MLREETSIMESPTNISNKEASTMQRERGSYVNKTLNEAEKILPK